MAEKRKKRRQLAENITKSFKSAFPLGDPSRTKADEERQLRRKKRKKRGV